MLNSWYAVALLSGLVSALTFAAAGVPTFAAAAVFLIAPLPLMLAGLRGGYVVAGAGGLVGLIALAAALGWPFALPYLLSTALPATVVSRLAMQHRPQPPTQASANGTGAAAAGEIEWYPDGRILLALAVMAGMLASIMVLVAGPDAESFRAATDQLLDRVLQIQVGDQAPTADQKQRLDSIRALFAYLLPAAAAIGWTISAFLNFRLAETLAARLKITDRALPRFGALGFPRLAAFALLATSLASLLPGSFGLIGGAFAGGLAAAFALLGLAVLHGLLEGHPARTMLLMALYLAVLVLGFALALPLIITALLDMFFNMRLRTHSSTIRKKE